KRLLIVADGPLAYVPFAALPDPNTGEPLFASHEIVRLPSATSLAVLREAAAGRRPASRSIAVLADPVFDAHDERLAPRRNPNGQSPHPDALQRALTETGLAIPRLSFARREADSISAAAPPRSIFRALGFDARKTLVTGPELKEYRIVHFATHGLLNV